MCACVGGFLLKHMWSACSQSAHMLVSVCVYPRVCLCTLPLRSGEAAGRRLEFRHADSKPGGGCGGGPLWRLSAVELQQEHQEQEGHPQGWRHSAAGTTAQVSRREHAHPCGGHPAGVCLRGEEGGPGKSILQCLHVSVPVSLLVCLYRRATGPPSRPRAWLKTWSRTWTVTTMSCRCIAPVQSSRYLISTFLHSCAGWTGVNTDFLLCSVRRTSKPGTWCARTTVCSRWFHCWPRWTTSSSWPPPPGPSGSVPSARRTWLSMTGLRALTFLPLIKTPTHRNTRTDTETHCVHICWDVWLHVCN